MKKLRVGTRGSELAQAQTTVVCERLAACGMSTEVVVIRTEGDRDQTSPFRRLGPDIFTKALDEALLGGRIDCAVHSAKDVPTTLPPPVEICAFPQRAEVEDALIFFNSARSLGELRAGTTVGTSSMRRRALLNRLRPDLVVQELRGNVRTRLRAAQDRSYAACVLARAGLERLGLGRWIGQVLDPRIFVPQAGQGALAVTACGGTATARVLAELLDHGPTRRAVEAERAYLRCLGGGCQVPAGANARCDETSLTLTAVLLHPGGSVCLRAERSAPLHQAEDLGRRVAEDLLRQGGERIISELKGQ